MKAKKRVLTLSLMLKASVYSAALFTFSVLLLIISYILMKGVPNIKPSLFEFTYTTENVSLFPSIIMTVMTVATALLIAAPLGIFTAIYLVEYSKKRNKAVSLIRITSETLSGIPSIVYGLFGMLFFVTTMKMGFSLISGALTVAIMVLPLIMRTTEEALIAVPDSYREASFGLGADRLRTVFRIVIPSAIPGILTGIILSAGRIVGESAALIFTAGTVAQIPGSLFASGRTLAVHMYSLASEGLHINEAYATAVVLLVIVLLINLTSSYLSKRLSKGYNK